MKCGLFAKVGLHVFDILGCLALCAFYAKIGFFEAFFMPQKNLTIYIRSIYIVKKNKFGSLKLKIYLCCRNEGRISFKILIINF